MKYMIKPGEVTKFSETKGTVQNVDPVAWVELSNTADFTHSVILHCHRHVKFGIQLYARLFDKNGLPAELRVVPFFLDTGGSSDSGESTTDNPVATDAEFDNMIDDVFNGTAVDDGSSPEFADNIDNLLDGTDDGSTIQSGDGGTVNINGRTYRVASDASFNAMLDDVGL